MRTFRVRLRSGDRMEILSEMSCRLASLVAVHQAVSLVPGHTQELQRIQCMGCEKEGTAAHTPSRSFSRTVVRPCIDKKPSSAWQR